MAVPTEPVSKLISCPQCGRLLADEPGPLCDVCSPPPVQPAVAVQPPSPPVAWATWSLIGVTAFISVLLPVRAVDTVPIGASFGPSVAGGQWWLLLSSLFIHANPGHFVSNMLPFVFLGRRLERVLGHWTFLAFYLICGGIAGAVSLFAHPEEPGFGASGAVFAVCGGLIACYSLQLHHFSWTQWGKFAVLVGIGALAAWPPELERGGRIDRVGHIAGLAVGLLLGFILSLPFAKPVMWRRLIFASATVFLLAGIVAFRFRDGYLVHLDSAARALESYDPGTAARELHAALAVKPDSPVGEYLARKLEQDRPAPVDCKSLLLNPFANFVEEPCTFLECDGRLHTMPGPSDTTIAYRGSQHRADPSQHEGGWRTEITTHVIMQALDEFNRTQCTTSWNSLSTQRVDNNGTPLGKPVRSRQGVGTISPWEPEAVALHKDTLKLKSE